MPTRQLQIKFNDSILVSALFILIVAFTVVYPLLSYLNLETEIHWLILQIFDLDDENNLPTWFSSFQLTIAAVLSLEYAQRSTKSKHWYLLGSGFLLLGIDEVAGLHESLNTAMESSWVLPAAIITAFVALYFIPFLRSLPSRLRYPFLAAGAIFLSGALLTEFLSEDMDEESFSYVLAVTLEEFLEMFGIWIFVRTLLGDRESG